MRCEFEFRHQLLLRLTVAVAVQPGSLPEDYPVKEDTPVSCFVLSGAKEIITKTWYKWRIKASVGD